jgi:hypothetical protein
MIVTTSRIIIKTIDTINNKDYRDKDRQYYNNRSYNRHILTIINTNHRTTKITRIGRIITTDITTQKLEIYVGVISYLTKSKREL